MSRVDPPRSLEAWMTFGRRLERVFDGTLERLRRLHPPADLAGAYEGWIERAKASRRAFRSLYRTVALRFPKVQSPDSRVSRALQRVDAADRSTRQWAQNHLTDLYSCFDVTPWMHARPVVTAACKGFYFCT